MKYTQIKLISLSTLHPATDDGRAGWSVFSYEPLSTLSCFRAAAISLTEKYLIIVSQYKNEAFSKRDPPYGRPLSSVSDHCCNIASYRRFFRLRSMGVGPLCCGMTSHPYSLALILSQCLRSFDSFSFRGLLLFFSVPNL